MKQGSSTLDLFMSVHPACQRAKTNTLFPQIKTDALELELLHPVLNIDLAKQVMLASAMQQFTNRTTSNWSACGRLQKKPLLDTRQNLSGQMRRALTKQSGLRRGLQSPTTIQAKLHNGQNRSAPQSQVILSTYLAESGVSFASHSFKAAAQMSRSVELRLNSSPISFAMASGVSPSGS